MRRTGPQKNNFAQGNIQTKQTVLAPATPESQVSKPISKQASKPVSKAISMRGSEEPEQQEDVKMEEELKMNLEEKKEDINLEEENDPKCINLDDSKKGHKGKKEYDLDDTVIRDITLAGDIHVQLISNTNGYFVDIRKFFKGYPTKKGIRMLASKFGTAAELLKADLAPLLPPVVSK